MKITKITDKYSFYKEGEGYILNLGTIRKGEDTKVELLFEGFEGLNLKGGCSCVTKTKTDLEEGKVKYTLKYTLCERDIIKTLTCTKNNINIKIIGKCR